MPEYDNRNTGVLFVNGRQRPGKQDPDYNGSVNIEGKEYWLSGWKKPGKDGKKAFLSLAVKPKDAPEQTQTKAEPAKPETHADNFDEDFRL